MKPVHGVIPVAIAALLLVGCASRTGPSWTPPLSTNQPGAPAAPASPAASTDPYASVLPVLTPKADLKPVPAGEVNTAYAPYVPAAATRTEQAIVEVHFDVVEGVQAIDPNGTQYTTWGYRLHGDNTVTTGTPGPIIRLRVGDVL